MIMGVDPHKGSHTATAVDAVTNTSVSSVRVEATIGVYRQLLRWACQFGERRWAVENAPGSGLSSRLSGLWPRTRWCSTRRPPRPPGCVSCLGAGDVRTT